MKQATFKANLQDSIVYYSSTDTIWANSRVFPDSLIPLDTIIDDNNWNDQATVKEGRYFLQSFSTIESPAHSGDAPFPNCNITIYVATIKNTMKIQISQMFISSHPQKPMPIDNIILDSMVISWSVDSLGNGIFIKPLGLIKQIPLQNEYNSVNSPERSFFFYKGYEYQFSLYDAIGRKLALPSNHILSSGMTIYTSKCDNQKCGKSIIVKNDM